MKMTEGIEMNMPTFAASLYKSTSSYRGFGRNAGLDTTSNVVAAVGPSPCEIGCDAAWVVAIGGCAVLGGWLGGLAGVICAAVATAGLEYCLSHCVSGGGGGSFGCCNGGTCCGDCQLDQHGNYHCYGQCIGPNQVCP